MQCHECKRELDPTEPIWLHWRPQSEDAKSRSNTARLVSICEPCRPRVTENKFVLGKRRREGAAVNWELRDLDHTPRVYASPKLPMKQCEACDRPMGMERRMVGTQRWRCSPECRHARSPRPTYEQACTICGNTFTARRDDAETCSSACRQKSYRRRRAAARDMTLPHVLRRSSADVEAINRPDDLDAAADLNPARSKLLAALVRRSG